MDYILAIKSSWKDLSTKWNEAEMNEERDTFTMLLFYKKKNTVPKLINIKLESNRNVITKITWSVQLLIFFLKKKSCKRN